jgi:prepilin-type N-terminal cleavage/methylation domain-containing protein
MDSLRRKYAFTLIEVLIVVAILGIIAAIVYPQFQDNTQQAKESAAKDTLRIMRTAIERYYAEHGIAPGYPADNIDAPPLEIALWVCLIKGDYISGKPENPFNKLKTVNMVRKNEVIPPPTDNYGWIYQPHTRIFKIDSTGRDSDGTFYYNY